ncbi:hypothetical protein Efla_005762 [Eimeria flavescens]
MIFRFKCLPQSRAFGSLAAHRHSTASYHHSVDLHRYYTNRYHKKVCPKCGRPNILPSTACACCSHRLTDVHICSVGRDVLRDLVLARHANHDQSGELESRLSLLKRGPAGTRLMTFEECLQGLPRPLSADGLGLEPSRGGCVEFFRSFDFVVFAFPFPASLLHLAAAPKASMYDLRQLRRSHVQLLKRMQEKLRCLLNLLIECWAYCAPPGPHSLPPQKEEEEEEARSERTSRCSEGEQQPLEDGTPDQQTSLGSACMQLRRLAAFGFNYPSEYSQLCLHAVAPPIKNFGIFEPPCFYSLSKVLSDLQRCGSVQTFSPSAIFSCEDSLLQTIKSQDVVARRLLGKAELARK